MNWYRKPPPRRRRRLSDDVLKNYGASFFVLLLVLQLLAQCAFGPNLGGEPDIYEQFGLRSVNPTVKAASPA